MTHRKDRILSVVVHGESLYGLDSDRIESEGVIMRCGLTPTDFMHIKGDYCEYDREASVLAARYMLQAMGRPDTEKEALKLADEVYDLVEGKMYASLMKICLERKYEKYFADGIGPQVEFLIKQAWKERNSGGDASRLLHHAFGSDYTLIGIGAPTHLFIPEVAKALGAGCLVPEHSEVANAIGALKADLNATVEVHITERFSNDLGTFEYIVHAPGGSVKVDTRKEAVELAKKEAEAQAVKEARARGAKSGIKVRSWEYQKEMRARTGERVRFALSVFAEAEVTNE